MDIFAHWLWTFVLFHNRIDIWWATLFGVLPDLLSFGILFVQYTIKQSFPKGAPSLHTLPRWVFTAYNVTHSLVIFVLMFLAVFLITKSWYIPLLAWAIHILIDIPTHTHRYFPTPFLWPISEYKFSGFSWAEPWFMIINYSALIAMFAVLFLTGKI